MNIGAFPRRVFGLGLGLAVAGVLVPSAAMATTCSPPALAQVFSWAQDTNWYAAVPAESWDSLGSTGWTLAGGAKFTSVTLADGKKGTVLDMPSGSRAASPITCVTNSYPTARTEIRNLSGTAGVAVNVSYQLLNGALLGLALPQANATITGVGTGWTLPKAFAINPGPLSGWQTAQFVLSAKGSGSEYLISNFYVDPRMH